MRSVEPRGASSVAAHDRLRIATERAASDIVLTASELRRIAANLPRRSRTIEVHLEAVATRLDAVGRALGHEVMIAPDAYVASTHGRIARHVLKVGLASLALIGAGTADRLGSDVYDVIKLQLSAPEQSLGELTQAAQVVLKLSASDSQSVLTADEPGDDEKPHEGAQSYTGAQAASVAGITHRQLDYWARTDLITPSLRYGGGGRRYTYQDLVRLKMVKTLLDAGIKLTTVRRVFTYLHEHFVDDIASANLVIRDSDVLLADGDELVDLVRGEGQGTLNVLPMAGVIADIDAQLQPNDLTQQ